MKAVISFCLVLGLSLAIFLTVPWFNWNNYNNPLFIDGCIAGGTAAFIGIVGLWATLMIRIENTNG